MATMKIRPNGQSPWIDMPSIRGATAYEQAVAGGYQGSESQFNAHLAALETAVTDAEQAEVDAQSAQTAAEAARDLAQGYAAQLAAGVASPAGSYADLADATEAVGRYYGLPVVNLFKDAGINKLTEATYLSDGVHINAAGAKRVAERVIAEFRKMVLMYHYKTNVSYFVTFLT